VGYHHDDDQRYYNYFARVFAGAYQIIRQVATAGNLERRCRIHHAPHSRGLLTGTSYTLGLCGKERLAEFVDWEIKATLDKQQG
jgi:hypothetical protein